MIEAQSSIGPATSPREDQLQFLRFLAFFNVFLYHADTWLFFPYPVAHCAKAAVSFFFILSGALTGYLGFGKERKVSPGGMLRDLRKKIGKFYLLYATTTLLSAMAGELPGQLGRMEFAAAMPMLKQLFRNLLLIQAWFPEGYYSFNGVGWFLSALVFLSVLNLPALALLNKLRKKGSFWLFALFFGILGTTGVYCYLTKNGDLDYLQYVLPLARSGEYLSGMLLGFGLCWMKPKLKIDKYKWVCTVLEIAALVIWYLFLSRAGSPWRSRIVTWLIPNLFLIGVFLVGKGRVSDGFRWKPLVLLGDLSMECFLIHQMIIQWFSQHNPEMQYNKPFGAAISLLACLLMTYLLAWQLHREKA